VLCQHKTKPIATNQQDVWQKSLRQDVLALQEKKPAERTTEKENAKKEVFLGKYFGLNLSVCHPIFLLCRCGSIHTLNPIYF
jgi:hypothetical protein